MLSRRKKDEVLAAFKTKSKSIPDSPGIAVAELGNRIFTNEHLTLVTKALLKKTRDFAKANGIKYTWVKNGVIFIRRDDRQKVKNISKEEDLVV